MEWLHNRPSRVSTVVSFQLKLSNFLSIARLSLVRITFVDSMYHRRNVIFLIYITLKRDARLICRCQTYDLIMLQIFIMFRYNLVDQEVIHPEQLVRLLSSLCLLIVIVSHVGVSV